MAFKSIGKSKSLVYGVLAAFALLILPVGTFGGSERGRRRRGDALRLHLRKGHEDPGRGSGGQGPQPDRQERDGLPADRRQWHVHAQRRPGRALYPRCDLGGR
ncbi:MAG: hypothetical protein M0C28_08210 [Candidatus Moduliflexus flocculans]|nr:hypothetical protein [Candidatus Moduliflexus flocculans]